SILRARGIASLIIGACRPSTTRLAFEWPDYSAVKIESTQITAPLYGVCVDQRQAARLAVRSLRELGYRRIGLATTPATQPRQDDFARAGFLLEQQRNRDGFFAPMIELSEDDRSDVVPRWIQKNRLDAIICDQPEMVDVLRAHHIKIPEEVAFAGLNVAASQADLAGIVADHTRVGGQAVEQVVSLLRTNQRGLPATASCTYVPVNWHPGASAPTREAR
ncbi:MAG TPA: substrate-binding domain-containing protein, partial [Opitutaceae bacterium]